MELGSNLSSNTGQVLWVSSANIHVPPVAFFFKNKFLPKDILTDFLGTTAGSGLGINVWPRESSSHVKDKVS